MRIKTGTFLVVIISLCCLLSGCRRGGADGFVTKGPDGVVTLAVGATADLQEPVWDFRLEAYYEPIGEILPSDDPRTFMTSMIFAYYDSESVLAFSPDGPGRVIRISLKDGSFLGEFGRSGRGPGEYVTPLFVFAKDGEVCVNDMRSICHVYSAADGSWLRDMPLEEETVLFSNYTPLEDGLGIVCHSSMSGNPRLFDIVDASGRIVREGKLSGDGQRPSLEEGIAVRYIRQTGDGYGLLTSDTGGMYRITAEGASPWLSFDPGHYSLTGKDRIVVSQIFESGRFVFLSIQVLDNYRQAVYDVQSGRLVFCSAVDLSEWDVVVPGFPYSRGGESVTLAPYLAYGGLLICRDVLAEDHFYCFRRKE
ncbi:MAG: hypothetical protein IJ701_02110 [Bacteroidales bacterium]|nr:hypothetical protein [Bacteroidales bacterium]